MRRLLTNQVSRLGLCAGIRFDDRSTGQPSLPQSRRVRPSSVPSSKSQTPITPTFPVRPSSPSSPVGPLTPVSAGFPPSMEPPSNAIEDMNGKTGTSEDERALLIKRCVELQKENNELRAREKLNREKYESELSVLRTRVSLFEQIHGSRPVSNPASSANGIHAVDTNQSRSVSNPPQHTPRILMGNNIKGFAIHSNVRPQSGALPERHSVALPPPISRKLLSFFSPS